MTIETKNIDNILFLKSFKRRNHYFVNVYFHYFPCLFNMATPYKLRCNLTGHEKDVRVLVNSIFPENGLISGSRDNTSCLWVENEYVVIIVLRLHVA